MNGFFSSVKTCHMFLENIQKNTRKHVIQKKHIMRIMRINLGGSMIIHLSYLSKYIDIHWNNIFSCNAFFWFPYHKKKSNIKHHKLDSDHRSDGKCFTCKSAQPRNHGTLRIPLNATTKTPQKEIRPYQGFLTVIMVPQNP